MMRISSCPDYILKVDNGKEMVGLDIIVRCATCTYNSEIESKMNLRNC